MPCLRRRPCADRILRQIGAIPVPPNPPYDPINEPRARKLARDGASGVRSSRRTHEGPERSVRRVPMEIDRPCGRGRRHLRGAVHPRLGVRSRGPGSVRQRRPGQRARKVRQPPSVRRPRTTQSSLRRCARPSLSFPRVTRGGQIRQHRAAPLASDQAAASVDGTKRLATRAVSNCATRQATIIRAGDTADLQAERGSRAERAEHFLGATSGSAPHASAIRREPPCYVVVRALG